MIRLTTDISKDTPKHLALKIVCALLVVGLVWVFGEALADLDRSIMLAERV